MDARRKEHVQKPTMDENSASTESSAVFLSAQTFPSQNNDKLAPNKATTMAMAGTETSASGKSNTEPGSKSPPPALIENRALRDKGRPHEELKTRRQSANKGLDIPTKQLANMNIASSSLPDPTGCFQSPIIEGVPEVLQAVHLRKLVPLLESEPEYMENLIGSGGSPVLSPLNAITPPPCVIQPKNHLLIPTHSASTAGHPPSPTATTAHGTSKAPISGSHFFDIYDVKSIGPYKLTKTLGSGSTGKVKLAVHEKTGEKLAVKIVPRDPPPVVTAPSSHGSHAPPSATAAASSSPSTTAPPPSAAAHGGKKKKTTLESALSKEARLLREVSLLSLLSHPHIVRLYGYSSTASYYLLFMEYVEGGQLLNYVISHGRLKERHACQFFRQLLSAVGYCHSNSVVHRDLKIENILIDNDGSLKLIDFGLSNFYDPNSTLNTFCGSLYYAAPELLSGKPYHGPEIDIWSLGVILYVLTTGKVPFDDKKLPVLHEKIKNGVVDYPSYLSPELRHVLSRMIVKDPLSRATMKELYENEWVVSASSCQGSPNLHVPLRFPLDPPFDPQVVHGIVQSLGCQYSPNLVLSFLYKAANDWQTYSEHPIISLYYLVKEKLHRWIQQNRSNSSIHVDASVMTENSDESTTVTGLGLWRHGRRYSSLASSISVTEPIRSHVSPRSPLPSNSQKLNRKSYLGSPKLNISTTKLTLAPSGGDEAAGRTTSLSKAGSQKSSQSSREASITGQSTGQSWMSHWMPGMAALMKSIRGDAASARSKEASEDSQASSVLGSMTLSPDVVRLKNIYLKGIFSVHVMPTHVIVLSSAMEMNEEETERYRVRGLKAALVSAMQALGLQFKETDTGLHVQYTPSLECVKGSGRPSSPATAVGRSSAHASGSSHRLSTSESQKRKSSSATHLSMSSDASPRRITFDVDIVRLGWTAELALQFRKWHGASANSHTVDKMRSEIINVTERNILHGPPANPATEATEPATALLNKKRGNSCNSLTASLPQAKERKNLVGSKSIPPQSAAVGSQSMSSPLRKSFTAGVGLGERERERERERGVQQ